MTIGRLIERRGAAVHTCDARTTVRDAVNQLAERRIGALPVIRNGAVVGMFSERDVIYRLRESGPAVLDQAVEAVMTTPAVTVDPETDVIAALALMTRRRIRHLPVVRDGQMIGLVSIGDLVKHRIEMVESEAMAMRDYIQSV